MEAFKISPVEDMAAIVQNGRHLPLASLHRLHCVVSMVLDGPKFFFLHQGRHFGGKVDI